jgi:putative 4-mercaptohistidine N1-methyltranferase
MSGIYETEKLLSEYLLFHYGTARELLSPARMWPEGMHEALDFAVRTPTHFSDGQVSRALDLGCAVGRSTFEMSRDADEVIGLDFSQVFIQAAEELCNGNSIGYNRRDEGVIVTSLQAKVPFLINPSKIRFIQGDAMDLPTDLGVFDRVHAANLICRLPEPKRLLDRLPSLVVPGGELVLATPCTWLEEFTPPGNWPDCETFEWLQQSLSPAFTLVKQTEEPFLIRETARKFQWTTSLVTIWQRKD